jgi:hypothetical protein
LRHSARPSCAAFKTGCCQEPTVAAPGRLALPAAGAGDPAKGWTYVGWGLPHVASAFERFVAAQGAGWRFRAPVASDPTVALTTGTFERYAGSVTHSKAKALRRAELALLDPALWAPFVLVGDGGPRAARGA